MKGRSGERHIRVATRLRQHLHLLIHSAKHSICRVCQSKIAVNECISRRTRAIKIGQASVP